MSANAHPGEDLFDEMAAMVYTAATASPGGGGPDAPLGGKFTRGWMDLMDGYVKTLPGVMSIPHSDSDQFTFAGFVFDIIENPEVKGIVYVKEPVFHGFDLMTKEELDLMENMMKQMPDQKQGREGTEA